MVLKNKRLFVTGLAGISLCLFLSLTVVFGLLNTIEFRISDLLYHPSKTDSDIVIISIDAKTLDSSSGLGDYSKFTRAHFAQAIDNLLKAKPKVVGVDIYFRDKKDPESDGVLAKVLDSATLPVVLGFYLNEKNFEHEENRYLASDIASVLPMSDFLKGSNVIPSFINLPANKDQVVRTVIGNVFDAKSNTSYDSFSAILAKQVNDNEEEVPSEFNINYFSDPVRNSPAASFKYISFIDVFNGTFDEALIKDKIVIIGATDKALQDYVVTPSNYAFKMPGVEVHANAIQTILEQKFLRHMYPWEKILLIIVFAFASVFVFMYTRIRWSLLYLIGVGGGYAFLAPVLFDRGVIVDLVRPYLALALAFVSVYVYRYITEFRQKTELKNAFSRFVNPAIVNQITAHPEMLKLGGENREVTVIFTDIRGFTSVSEKLKPESLVALLNEYLEKMSDVIFDEDGTVDKYEGDAILAFFGAPVPQADHAERACRTVLKMRRALTELNAKWATDPPLPGGEKKPQIEFRAGINSGEVIVGNVGSAKKLNYTVIGDNVNLASRLEGVNKLHDTRILIGEETFEKVKDLFVTREIDLIRAVGKQRPVRIYELLTEKSATESGGVDLSLLRLYEDGISLYKERKFGEGLAKFEEILKAFPDDGPSKSYRQRCEILRDFPPKADWDGVYEMGSK
jgi:adenylate cyclase